MSQEDIIRIVRQLDEFPALPAIVNKVLEITSDPDSTTDDLLEVISMDQAIIVDILKLANSAFFGRAMGVSSLREAIGVLGMNQIRNLVIAKIVFNRFKHFKGGDQFDIKQFWKHSFLCSIATKIVASELGEDPDDFFILGLIHDIGKLFICIQMPDEFLKILQAADFQMSQTYQKEKDIIGISHDEIGLMLLERWFFPDQLIFAVGFHHQPEKNENSFMLSMVVNIADRISHSIDQAQEDRLEPIDSLFYSKSVELFKNRGITLNKDTIHKFKESLETQKDDALEALNLLLS